MTRWKAELFVNSEVGSIETEVSSSTYEGARQQIYAKHGNVQAIYNLREIDDVNAAPASSWGLGESASSVNTSKEDFTNWESTWEDGYKSGCQAITQAHGQLYFYKAMYLSDKYISLYLEKKLAIGDHPPVPCSQLIDEDLIAVVMHGNAAEVTSRKARNFIGDSTEKEFLDDIQKYSDFDNIDYSSYLWNAYFCIAKSILRLLITVKASGYTYKGLQPVVIEGSDHLDKLLYDHSIITIGILVTEGWFEGEC